MGEAILQGLYLTYLMARSTHTLVLVLGGVSIVALGVSIWSLIKALNK